MQKRLLIIDELTCVAMKSPNLLWVSKVTSTRALVDSISEDYLLTEKFLSLVFLVLDQLINLQTPNNKYYTSLQITDTFDHSNKYTHL